MTIFHCTNFSFIMFYRISKAVNYIEQILSSLRDVILFLNILQIVISSLKTKKNNWIILENNLKKFKSGKNNKTYFWIFILPQIIFILNFILVVYCYNIYFKLQDTVTAICVCFQYYS